LKVKLFTHTDLDGIGCAIVGKYAFEDIHVEYCEYDNVNEKVNTYITDRNYLEFDHTFIKDISVSELNADLLNYIYNNGSNITLIDHHDTAKWLNKYEWAWVDDYHKDELNDLPLQKSSGTSMFYELLIAEKFIDPTDELDDFTELVRRYDAWEWNTKYNDHHAKQLNDLLYIIGRERFLKRFDDNLNPAFNEQEIMLLEMEEENIKKYITSKSKQLIERDINGYKVGVVFAERYSSQLGNELAKENPHLDLIAIINPSYSVSYRTVKDDVHLGEFAKLFGGGGHPKAAGSPISVELKEELISVIFQ